MFPLPVRINADTLPALVVGALLLSGAAVLFMNQWFAYRRLDPGLSELGTRILERQIRYRLAVGALLFLIGIAIPVGDQLDFFFRVRPGLFFAYWVIVLMLVLAMVVIVLGDLLSTLAYAKVSQDDLRHEQQALEQEIQRFRASQNGRHTDESKDDAIPS